MALLLPLILLGIISSDTISHLGGVIFLALIWIFGANVFYTMSWAAEILIYKHLGRFVLNNNVRTILYCIGLIFSMIWTYLGI